LLLSVPLLQQATKEDRGIGPGVLSFLPLTLVPDERGKREKKAV
jgi:hypothetical protein